MRPARATTLPLLVFALLAVLPLDGGAQARLVGRVIDDITQRPLGGALVTARAFDGRFLTRVESADDGTFELAVGKGVSAVQLDVRRISYRANTMPLLHFDGRNFFQVEVRLDPDAILLAPLQVIAWSDAGPSPFLDGFRQRLGSGVGTFITREQIEARRPTFMVDLLREIPGVIVTGSGPGNRSSVTFARAQAMAQMSGCEAQIWVDGFLMNRRSGALRSAPADFRLDDVVSPMDVEGIEVHRGLGTVPAEFLNPDARCGVIAIWTRRGERRR